jgi:hypothetical protein
MKSSFIDKTALSMNKMAEWPMASGRKGFLHASESSDNLIVTGEGIGSSAKGSGALDF